MTEIKVSLRAQFFKIWDRNNLSWASSLKLKLSFLCQDVILGRPPTRCAYGNVAKEATSSKLLPYNPHVAKIVPSISNEKLNKPQAIIGDKFLVKGSVNDRSSYVNVALNPFAQPGYNGSSFYDPWSNQLYQSTTPYGLPYQKAPVINATYQEAPIVNAASEFAARHSYFTTSPPIPISLPPVKSHSLSFTSHLYIFVSSLISTLPKIKFTCLFWFLD